jgi:6 kDa early secretory antigenic target
MADGQIKVGFDAIATAGEGIGSSAQRIQQQLSDLKSYLAPIVSEWTGRAQEGWQQQQSKWDQAANDLQNVLQAISRAVQEAHGAYVQTEQSNTAVWS